MVRHANSYRVLIVGCGQLGSRHLQAVSTLPMVREVEIVDPDPKALEVARKLLTDTPKRQSSVSFRWVSSIEEASKGGDICIVATQAEGRRQIISDVVNLLGYRHFLIEKIVVQSARDYEELMHFSRRKQLSIWVNCKTRAYPIHKHIKEKLKPGEPILFNSIAGNHGLANNGLHTADLFVFYDEADAIELVGSQVDPILHPSKRGPTLFDLSGTLQGVTQKGSHFTLSFARDHVASEHISIVTKNYRCIVDHMLRWAFENDGEGESPWRPVLFNGNLLVSEMTKTFITDILNSGWCELPTLRECFPAHRFVLGSLLPHFNRLSKTERDYCPVT